MLKIRLSQEGRRNRRTHAIVLSDSRKRRDSYKQKVGSYDPLKDLLLLNEEGEKEILEALEKGAQVTEKLHSLLISDRSSSPFYSEWLRKREEKILSRKLREKAKRLEREEG